MEKSWNCVFEFLWEPCCLTVAIVTDALLLFFVTGYLHTQYDPDKMSKSLKNTISIQDMFNCSYCHS